MRKSFSYLHEKTTIEKHTVLGRNPVNQLIGSLSHLFTKVLYKFQYCITAAISLRIHFVQSVVFARFPVCHLFLPVSSRVRKATHYMITSANRAIE